MYIASLWHTIIIRAQLAHRENRLYRIYFIVNGWEYDDTHTHTQYTVHTHIKIYRCHLRYMQTRHVPLTLCIKYKYLSEQTTTGYLHFYCQHYKYIGVRLYYCLGGHTLNRFFFFFYPQLMSLVDNIHGCHMILYGKNI